MITFQVSCLNISVVPDTTCITVLLYSESSNNFASAHNRFAEIASVSVAHHWKTSTIFQFDSQLSPRHLQTSPSISARMGCALNPERLRTELCSNHEATLTGGEAQPMRP